MSDAPIDPQALSKRGIEESYVDLHGTTRYPPGSTLRTLCDALVSQPAESSLDAVSFMRPDDVISIPSGHAIELEDGTTLKSGDQRIPSGYHWHLEPDGTRRLIVVAPESCFLPPNLRAWGWAIQLYALRSRASWGIGDLADLEAIARDASKGDGFVLLNPMHAVSPGFPQEPSPYYAGSRCFLNPLYLHIENIPQARGSTDLEELARAGRALLADRRIDRDAIYALKMQALEATWERFEGDSEFETFRIAGDATLEGFATYMALAETYGGQWQVWPTDVRRPDGPGIGGFRRANHGRVRFHMWVQWWLDKQARAAAASSNLVHDLAIGVAPNGADGWLWQDSFVAGACVGAPPDDYNDAGQNWAALAFDPGGLERASYEPFIATLRAAMRYGAGVRIDHVMGLFRLFLIPDGADATDGAYVRYPAQRLLDIVALESEREGTFVIGEDLGTVESNVREEMSQRSLLSYKLMWFEDEAPSHYPEEAMAGMNTHDLPTFAGLWSGQDTAASVALGLDPNEGFKAKIFARISAQLEVSRAATPAEVIDRSYEALATSPCRLVMGSFEDVLEVMERHNHPGTAGPWNWSTALPESLEDILSHPRKAVLQAKLSDRARV